MNSCSLHKLSHPEPICPVCIEEVSSEIFIETLIKRVHKNLHLSIATTTKSLARLTFSTMYPSNKQITFVEAVLLLKNYEADKHSLRELTRGT